MQIGNNFNDIYISNNNEPITKIETILKKTKKN